MTTSITIRWDGSARGLREHRVSLALWLKPLSHLLRAVRRTASGIVTEAVDDPAYGAGGGRLHRVAEGLDLEITEIRDGCVQVVAEVALDSPPGELQLDYPDLLRRTAVRVVEAIERESRGQRANHWIHRFLQELPEGVEVQQYTVHQNGEQVAHTDVGSVELAPDPEPLSCLKRLTGTVVAAGFEEGKESVTVKSDGRSWTAGATPDQLELALGLRGQEVDAMLVVESSKYRLVWLREAGSPRRAPEGTELVHGLEQRWQRTLEILAQ